MENAPETPSSPSPEQRSGSDRAVIAAAVAAVLLIAVIAGGVVYFARTAGKDAKAAEKDKKD